MKPLVSDALWDRLLPLLPPPPKRRFRFPGRKPLDYRKILPRNPPAVESHVERSGEAEGALQAHNFPLPAAGVLPRLDWHSTLSTVRSYDSGRSRLVIH
jgi:hypothetical protein